MIKRVSENFMRGLVRIKRFAVIFSERLKIELAVVKLLYRSDEMTRKKDELLQKIGQRVYEMKGHPEKMFLSDRLVAETIAEIDKIEKDVEDLKQKVSEMSGLSA